MNQSMFFLILTAVLSASSTSTSIQNRTKRSYKSEFGLVEHIKRPKIINRNLCLVILNVSGPHKNVTFDEKVCLDLDPFLEQSPTLCHATLLSYYWSVSSRFCVECANKKLEQNNTLNVPVLVDGKVTVDPYRINMFVIHPRTEKMVKCGRRKWKRKPGYEIGLIKTVLPIEDGLSVFLPKLIRKMEFSHVTCHAAKGLAEFNTGSFEVEVKKHMTCLKTRSLVRGCWSKQFSASICETILITNHRKDDALARTMLRGAPLVCGETFVAVLVGGFADRCDGTVDLIWAKIQGDNYDWIIRTITELTSIPETRSIGMISRVFLYFYPFYVTIQSFYYTVYSIPFGDVSNCWGIV